MRRSAKADLRAASRRMATRTGLPCPSFETALRASSGRGRRVLQQPPACARVAGNAKRPLGFPAGAIPTVDFLLYHLALIVKKVRVKTLVRSLFGPSDNKKTSTHKDDLDLILRAWPKKELSDFSPL